MAKVIQQNQNQPPLEIKRGDIFYADLAPHVGSEQGGIRPVLVIQNDIGNKYSPTVIVAAITSQIGKAKFPTHVEIRAGEFGLSRDSVILLEQIRTIDKVRLKNKVGKLSDEVMEKVNQAILISLGLIEWTAEGYDWKKKESAGLKKA
ncbi:mRNA interferase MazF [Caldicellulosiruptor bescii]|uniref:Transcriptional modulator of MazE/toxin, MazF n=2 Tax=Caldicellulosiruptor bescii TaxID=31899 RepID=B9MKY1_CALBD|nr:transcriptional modulator of MazE/toxin, MazF [Caldicellulosiruptor bescii DSM 6725]PBC89198.1 mRNA interferase MazF [Caldicellulosiruptor bescii]PBC91320.1 mRNA interferase MazF [Caldicellulosiruptor bescii]PBD03268.1 mRNA interferase MazF [Caldicellulosiruptor bescii]PBD07118.1 mRNA interferase MazF [Caldicellulosiruptor bescii]